MNTFSHPLIGSEEGVAGDLYFAFGSNMRLQQMAERCPGSALFAKGILRKYKCQINSRGGGNVVEGNSEDLVEGIIFTVSHSDVRALRHFEGIEQQFFVEKRLNVEVVPFPDTIFAGRKTEDAAGLLAQHSYHHEPGLTASCSSPDVSIPNLDQKQLSRTKDDEHAQSSRVWSTPLNQSASKLPSNSVQSGAPDKFSHDEPRMSGQKNVVYGALVYVCREHQLPGEIRGEYRARMRLAMADARMLGVSRNYLDTSLHPLVFGEPAGSIADETRFEQPKPAPSTQTNIKTTTTHTDSRRDGKAQIG